MRVRWTGVACDLCVDGAGVAGDVSVHQGDVGFVYVSRCELFGEVAMRGVCAGDQQHATRVAVDAVHDAGALVAAYVGERLEMMQQRVHQRAGVTACTGVERLGRRVC